MTARTPHSTAPAPTLGTPPAAGPATGAACPSCTRPMQVLRLPSQLAHHLQNSPGPHAASTASATQGDIEIDLCFGCHGIWFDAQESLQLSPQGVIDLFRTLHAHTDTPHTPLAARMGCPRCAQPLHRSQDRTLHGRYVLWRCAGGHGRFLTFSSFMLEKGFARQLRPAEVEQLARSLRIIHCGSCGAAVDVRQDHACPYCRAAFSLLDPQAVAQALAHYEQKASAQADPDRAQLIAAIAQSHRLQLEHEREEKSRTLGTQMRRDALWGAGLEAVLTIIAGLFIK